MPNSFQIKERKWSMANAGGPTENLAMRKPHAFRNRFLTELRSEIKYPMNALKIYFIICSMPICSGLRTSIRKVLSVTFFTITATIGGCALKMLVFWGWTSHFHYQQFKCYLSAEDF